MTALHLVMMKPGIMYEGDTVQLERKSASNRVEEVVKRGEGLASTLLLSSIVSRET